MTVQPSPDDDQQADAENPGLVRCDNCGRYGWHETGRCPGRTDPVVNYDTIADPVDLDPPPGTGVASPLAQAMRAAADDLANLESPDFLGTQRGRHTRPETQCPPWCEDAEAHARNKLRADRNCWGPERSVVLHLEHHAPSPDLGLAEQLEMDPPCIAAYPYRRWHCLPIVYLHLYRPHENQHLDLDTNLKLTAAEARQLADNLMIVADEIEVV